ncbi:MAG TPA: STAS domain-containing protein [Nitrospirota bacterium]|jgi:anti-anti-sigma factor|nr:STAS domain-containing protein [Nitrospirota bacterium]
MDTKLKVYQMNLEGEIDAAKMAEIGRVIGQLIKGEMYGLILNFESAEHVHFTVLPALVEEKKRLQSFGGDIRLAGMSEYLKNIFRTTGVLEEFQVFDSAQQAAKSFGVAKPATNLPLGL